MELNVNSKSSHLNKTTYVNLRWIGIIGQFLTINSVAFIFKFEFNFILANFVVLVGVLSNVILFIILKKSAPRNYIINFFDTKYFAAKYLLYLTGGIINPFSIFLIIPSIFASNSLSIKTNILLILLTISSIVFLTFFIRITFALKWLYI